MTKSSSALGETPGRRRRRPEAPRRQVDEGGPTPPGSAASWSAIAAGVARLGRRRGFASGKQAVDGLGFIATGGGESVDGLFSAEAHFDESGDGGRIAFGLSRVGFGPEFGGLFEFVGVGLVHRRDLGVLGIVGLGGTEEGLKGKKRGLDGQSRGPLVFEDVQADGPGLGRNVRVPDLGQELHPRRLEGISPGDGDGDLVAPSLVGRSLGAVDRP
eukprot:CAMPEP_0197424874 /NCGR_PEP_ID=MMETSP1170-20131217/28348_1 /TAXON_ID=54406 /ORGANISM="Sarcinochrysis sp, Strain CCMP770" /LENGTH=214 /DNA_ID=CAMNT_0042952381 /DNA_START=68 /DNA_END=709 /DNA_ORIENTATION=+